MNRYVIFRLGSNAANQPGEFGWVPVYAVDAETAETAEQAAVDAGVMVYANQSLKAFPYHSASDSERTAADEAVEVLAAFGQMFD